MISEEPPVATQYLKEAGRIGRLMVAELKGGSISLEDLGTKMEIEARIWGQNLHAAILEEISRLGLPPDQFEERATGSARDIVALAVAHFTVRCGPGAKTAFTPMMIGEIPGVIATQNALAINTSRAIAEYLKRALADYPQQYRRQNLSVYKLNFTRRTTANTNQPDSGRPNLERLIDGTDRVDIATAARYLELSGDHVRRLVRAGKLVRLGQGRPVKVSTKSLREYKGS